MGGREWTGERMIAVLHDEFHAAGMRAEFKEEMNIVFKAAGRCGGRRSLPCPRSGLS
jgi:hypothetical protein